MWKPNITLRNAHFGGDMRKGVSVIGVGGVGMAHVIGAVRAGYEIDIIIDSDPQTLIRAQKSWTNVWGDFSESAPVQESTVFSLHHKIPAFIDDALLIIATPPHTHNLILSDLNKRESTRYMRKIVEKPTCYPDSPLMFADNTTVSSEWVHHPKLKEIKHPIQSFHMSYPKSQTTDWGYELPTALSFIPHFFSILHNQSYALDGVRRVDDGFFRILTDKGDVSCFVSRDEPYGFWINGILLEWHPDLFKWQIQRGKGELDWEDACVIEEKLREAL